MAINQDPIPGAWFSNLNGQHIRVLFMIYSGDRISRVVLQYHTGLQKAVSIDEWNMLDLIIHPRYTEEMGEITNA